MKPRPSGGGVDHPMIRFLTLLAASLSFGISLTQYYSAKASGDVKPQAVGEAVEETGFSQSIDVSRLLLDTFSEYQRIQVYESAKPYFGRILVLDGVLQLAEGDAAAYNEMMAHVALFQHPHPRRILIIGGGDGHVLAEVLKHKSVEHVDHVDLDGHVIQVCQEFFPQWDKWDDPRVHLHITDGAAYCRDKVISNNNVTYDVIIQDSSDPWTTKMTAGGDSDGHYEKQVLPSSVLYTEEHLRNVHRMLEPNHGIFVFQAEMLQIPSDLEGVAAWRRSALEAGFSECRYGSISIASYPTGQIGFMLCDKATTPTSLRHSSTKNIQTRFKSMQTKYYHPGLQTASFVLPLWADETIYGTSVDSTTSSDRA
ncbi:hypothetical protein ACA910_018691 [Epithemia clementina (nom. ined.)]